MVDKRKIPPVVVGAVLAAALALAAAAPAAAAVETTSKQLLILRPGIDAIWGSYIFALQNDGAAAEPFKGRVMLPKETVDFQAQEGAEPSELALADDGGVMLEKQIDNGVHVVGIGFKVDAALGAATMTFTAVSPVANLNVLIPKGEGTLQVSSDILGAPSEASPDPGYVAMGTTRPLAAGETFVLKIGAVPEGRSRIWGVGGAVAGVLVLIGAALAWRTRPRIKEGAAQAFIIG
jgi:hypothetical protein